MSNAGGQSKRWRITLIKGDGSCGSSFFCVTVAQRAMVALALHAAGATFMVEEFAA